MSAAPRRTAAPLRFVTSASAEIELTPRGKHWWLSKPGLTETRQLILVRVKMPAGAAHDFHYHPGREEIIYIVEGSAEQWVDRDRRTLKAGDSAFIPPGVVHAIRNAAKKPMTFLAILSPAEVEGPFLIDCYDEEPWRSLGRPAKGRSRPAAKRTAVRRPRPA